MKGMKSKILIGFFLLVAFLIGGKNVEAADCRVESCSVTASLVANPATSRTFEIAPINCSCDSVCESYGRNAASEGLKIDSCKPIITIAKPVTPASASEQGGLIPCGNTGQSPCNLCFLISGIKGLIDWGMKIIVVLAVLGIFISGIMYIISAGDSGMMESAKNFMRSVVIGVAIFLGAWLIVNSVIWILGANIGQVVGRPYWYSFSCEINRVDGLNDSFDDGAIQELEVEELLNSEGNTFGY